MGWFGPDGDCGCCGGIIFYGCWGPDPGCPIPTSIVIAGTSYFTTFGACGFPSMDGSYPHPTTPTGGGGSFPCDVQDTIYQDNTCSLLVTLRVILFYSAGSNRFFRVTLTYQPIGGGSIFASSSWIYQFAIPSEVDPCPSGSYSMTLLGSLGPTPSSIVVTF